MSHSIQAKLFIYKTKQYKQMKKQTKQNKTKPIQERIMKYNNKKEIDSKSIHRLF